MKKNRIEIRISEEQKARWKDIAKQNGLNLSEFIEHKVEGNFNKKDVKSIFTFIEDTTNTFNKVENNINQIAKWVNTNHQVTPEIMQEYILLLQKIANQIDERNKIFRQIISKISE